VCTADIWGKEDVAGRLDAATLVQPQFEPNSREDIEYPDWLEGTWDVTSEMTAFTAPLGNKFLGERPPPLLCIQFTG
jgi:hypothetical protein